MSHEKKFNITDYVRYDDVENNTGAEQVYGLGEDFGTEIVLLIRIEQRRINEELFNTMSEEDQQLALTGVPVKVSAHPGKLYGRIVRLVHEKYGALSIAEMMYVVHCIAYMMGEQEGEFNALYPLTQGASTRIRAKGTKRAKADGSGWGNTNGGLS